MKAYSLDLRERIVTVIGEGKTHEEVARLFHVSLSTVKRYVRQWREEGNLLPKPIPGRPSKKLALMQAGLQAQLEASPGATLEERCRHWEAQEDIKVSISTMSRAIRLLKIDPKKEFWMQSERYREAKRKRRENRVHDKEERSATHSQSASVLSNSGRNPGMSDTDDLD